jgi:hypothetical protein
LISVKVVLRSEFVMQIQCRKLKDEVITAVNRETKFLLFKGVYCSSVNRYSLFPKIEDIVQQYRQRRLRDRMTTA